MVCDAQVVAAKEMLKIAATAAAFTTTTSTITTIAMTAVITGTVITCLEPASRRTVALGGRRDESPTAEIKSITMAAL